MKIVLRSHVGNVRKNNEDFVYADISGKVKYAIVADGMGGAAAGEIASKIAVYAAGQYLKKDDNIKDIDVLKEAVLYANEQILSEVSHNEALQGMGTTLTLAYFYKDIIKIAHVGDSAAYVADEKEIKKITKDHTYVQRLIDNGMLEEEDAEVYPLKNIITRVVGMEGLEVDGFEVSWNCGNCLFMCTDGLSNHVKKEEVFSVLTEETDLDTKADKLLAAALERGGRDNVSFLIAQNTDDEV